MAHHGRVLVIGDNDLAGLATVRSLGRAGLEVHLVRLSGRPVTRYSRFARRQYSLSPPRHDPAAFRAAILALVDEQSFDLVIPINDAALVALMPARRRINQRSILAAPHELGFDATYDKARTFELANQLGIDVPRTLTATSVDDVEAASRFAEYPLALKPSRSLAPSTLKKNVVRIAGCSAQLRQWLPEMLRHGPVLVQEFCPGHGVGVCILGKDGDVLAAFQHRRVHEPPMGGASSYRCSMPLDESLLAAVRVFCQEIRWTGPAMFEFKQDPATGRAVLMEINGRFWGSLALAVQSGVDFPRLLYDLLVRNETRRVFHYRAPHFTRYTPQEPYWLRANWRAPAGRSDVLKRSGWQVLAELRNVLMLREGYDIESVTDPLPGLMSWWSLAREISMDLRDSLAVGRGRRELQRIGRRVRRQRGEWERRVAGARNILFLCHGNIHRSAVAARRLRERLGHAAAGIQTFSAGFISRDNRSTSTPSLEVARRLGVDLSAHRSTCITREMLEQADLVVIMDARNARALRDMDARALRRSIPLGALDPTGPMEILDPYGQPEDVFEATYRRIIRCVDALAERLRAANRGPTARREEAMMSP